MKAGSSEWGFCHNQAEVKVSDSWWHVQSADPPDPWMGGTGQCLPFLIYTLAHSAVILGGLYLLCTPTGYV